MRKGLLYTLWTIGVLSLAACGGGATPAGTQEATNGESGLPTGDEQAALERPTVGSADPAASDVPRVLFLGDSITAGYQLDPEAAFPALLQTRLDSTSIEAVLVNAGLSGETSAGGLRRMGWLLRQPHDVLFLELGGNDGLRGIDLASTRTNLQGIVDQSRAANPDVVLVVAGMEIPPNLGQDYTRSFRTMYPELAEANGALLIPFLLDGVAGVDSLMLGDQIHPNAEGHQAVADLVWPYLLEAIEAVPQN